MKHVFPSAAMALSVLLPLAGAPAETTTGLHEFMGNMWPHRLDGGNPEAGLVMDASGALYGTTPRGGDGICAYNPGQGCGTVFKVIPPATGETKWTERLLHQFKGKADGAGPSAGLAADASGALYGTTSGGDTATEYGTVFELTPPAVDQTAWGYKVLYRFKGGTNGFYPAADLLVGDGGVLYGTTTFGGSLSAKCLEASTHVCGVVFALKPTAGKTSWTYQELYRFQGGTDGAYPQGGLIADASGALFGTTAIGGDATSQYSGDGTVFKLTPPAPSGTAWTETVIHRFNPTNDGTHPRGNLVADAKGALYGTTLYGGSGGTVYKLTPSVNGSVWTESLIYQFSAGSDYSPLAGVIMDSSGALYGTTSAGDASGCGAVFKLTPPTGGTGPWVETAYRFFRKITGCEPRAGVIMDRSGALYGTTVYGGPVKIAGRKTCGGGDCGVVFRVVP